MERDSAGRRFKQTPPLQQQGPTGTPRPRSRPMPGGWYGGMVGGAVKGEIVTGKTKDLVEAARSIATTTPPLPAACCPSARTRRR